MCKAAKISFVRISSQQSSILIKVFFVFNEEVMLNDNIDFPKAFANTFITAFNDAFKNAGLVFFDEDLNDRCNYAQDVFLSFSNKKYNVFRSKMLENNDEID